MLRYGTVKTVPYLCPIVASFRCFIVSLLGRSIVSLFTHHRATIMLRYGTVKTVPYLCPIVVSFRCFIVSLVNRQIVSLFTHRCIVSLFHCFVVRPSNRFAVYPSSCNDHVALRNGQDRSLCPIVVSFRCFVVPLLGRQIVSLLTHHRATIMLRYGTVKTVPSYILVVPR